MKRGIIDNPHSERGGLCAKVGLLLNLVLSVSAVSAHKYLFVAFNYPNLVTTLTHLGFSTVCIHTAAGLGCFTVVRIPWRPVLILSVGFCMLVTFANLSLQYNTLGTFLMLKTTTLFWIPAVHLVKYKYVYSRKTLLALSPVAVGAALHFYYDIHLNLRGVSYGLLSAVATSFYQVYVSEKQREMQVNSLQLLFFEAPIAVVLSIPPVLYFELHEARAALRTPDSILVYLGISCVCASFVHFTTHWTIGNTTCTEYNVVSQFKFASTLIIAYTLFDTKSVVFGQIVGDVTALCGIIIYTHLKLVEVTQERIDRRDRVVFPTRRV